MSQIIISKSHTKPDDELYLIGSDAKNALPYKMNNNITLIDLAGLSWIFLEDPLEMGNYA